MRATRGPENVPVLGVAGSLLTIGSKQKSAALRLRCSNVTEGAARGSLLLASTGGSKEEPRPASTQSLTRPLIRGTSSLRELTKGAASRWKQKPPSRPVAG